MTIEAPRTSATRQLAEALASVPAEGLLPDTTLEAKRVILDVLSSCLLGARTPEADAYRRCFASDTSEEGALVVGTPPRFASTYAATVCNTAISHQVEFGPAVSRAVVHLDGIVAAVLALAQRLRASGDRVLHAVALGCEAQIRFGSALAHDPSRGEAGDYPVAFRRGWWTPASLTPLGVATAAASLLGPGADILHEAWGLACNMCPTATLKMTLEGASGKGMVMGVGAGSGLLAAELACDGLTGLEDILGGWFPLMVEAFDENRLIEGLGSRWEFNHVLYKDFATAGPLFAPLEAALALVEEHGVLDPKSIGGIDLDCYHRTLVFSTPDAPKTGEAARSNLGYCLAVALLTGRRGLFLEEAFTPEWYTRAEILAVAQMVRPRVNQEYDDLYPEHAAKAALRVTLKDGSVLHREADRDAIDRYHVPTREHLGSKFQQAWRLLDTEEKEADVEAVVDAVWELEHFDDASELMGRVAGILGHDE
jgi:2-methylcitrate dehydratase PrpD